MTPAQLMARWVLIRGALRRPTLVDRIRLCLTVRQDIAIPREAAIAQQWDWELTDLFGNPVFDFKFHRGVWYFYGAMPSPGFPGS